MQSLVRRAACALTLGLVAVVLVGGSAALAGADPVEASANFHGKSKNGVYLVRLADLPVVAYDGSVGGYKATAPRAGRKIDPNAPDVVKYVDYLDAKHDALVTKSGAYKLYDYDYSLNGFAAKMAPREAMQLAAQDGVLSVEPDQAAVMDTITTPSFLGLDGTDGTWSKLGGVSSAGEDMILGDIDTGVWPENPAFSDRTGTGPNGQTGKLDYHEIPGWHGKCTPGEDFTASDCNQKLIGAQYFVAGHGGADSVIPEDFVSARDFDGHGSHTASTAVGNNGVQVTGDLPEAMKGKASGMAPRARLAVYKACWELPDHSQVSCFNSDTTAAIDQAVADGVDAINFSIAGTSTNFLDSVEVAFLFAANAGVFVSASAGNSGPTASTVAHPSPWITTVAASTHNRSFSGTVTLGNGATYTGISLTPAAGPAPLILASDAGLEGADPNLVRQCFSASANGGTAVLDPAKVAGKVVLCERGGAAPSNARVDKPLAVKDAGGVGTIIGNIAAGASLNADIHVAPTIHVDNVATAAIKTYAASTASPTASLSAGVPTLTAPAPSIAGFSSRGPSLATADQLKPDLSAPGVDILAAVSPAGHHGRMFDLDSGTSMSAPHIAGLSLLVKQAHPTWTPDMIKSAMMTTAFNLLGTVDQFAQGAGHVDPTKFLDPGLVYKTGGFNRYLGFLCGTGQLVASYCPSITRAANQLNLPSMAIGSLAGSATLNRTVTSVGSQSETFAASVTGLTGVTTAVSPSTFTVAPGASQAYAATFTESTAPFNSYVKGFITLTGDRGHVVRIPVVVRPVKIAAPAELALSGSADKSYGVVTGYNGTLAYSVRGLVPGAAASLAVPLDPAFNPGNPHSSNAPETDVTVAAGTKLARFSLFQSDTTANDLDLYVYSVNGTTLTLVGQSTGPTAEEQVQLTNPPAGVYAVFVDGFDTNGQASVPATLYSWQLGSANAGNMTATGPTTAAIGAAGNVTLHFTGLASNTRYLGAVDYTDGSTTIGTTLVRLNS